MRAGSAILAFPGRSTGPRRTMKAKSPNSARPRKAPGNYLSGLEEVAGACARSDAAVVFLPARATCAAMAFHGRAVSSFLVVHVALGAATADFAGRAAETRAAFSRGSRCQMPLGRPALPWLACGRMSATINIIEDRPRAAAVQKHGGSAGQRAAGGRPDAPSTVRLAGNRTGISALLATVDEPTFADIKELAKSADQLGERPAARRPRPPGKGRVRDGAIRRYLQGSHGAPAIQFRETGGDRAGDGGISGEVGLA